MAESSGAEALLDLPSIDPAPRSKKSTPAVVLELLRLSFPVVLSNVVSWSQAFFTIWLLGGSNKLNMAAFGLSNVLCNITGHCLLWGVGAGLDTLVSQAWGAQEYKAIGLYMQRVLLILTLVVNVPVIAIWLNATPILLALKQDPQVADKVAIFARLRIPGLFLQGPGCVFQKALSAMGKTHVLAALSICGVGISCGLCFLFMSPSSPAFALLSDPVAGSALASTLVDGLVALVLFAAWLCDADCRRCWPGWTRHCWRGWWAYLQIAVPALLMGIFEWWSWDIVNFLAGLCHEHGHDAKTSLATNALLGNIISLAYCIPIGLQTGMQTLVGNALGAQSPLGAKHVASIGLVLVVLVMACQAGALVAARDLWAHLFSAEPAVGQYVAQLLPWVVIFNAGDGIQLVLSGVITGAGKQHVTTPVLGVSYWVLGLPLGALAAFYRPGNGLLGLWWGMTLAVWLHVSSYLVICFAWPCMPWAIDWAQAARLAAERLAEPSADAIAAAAPNEPDVVPRDAVGSINAPPNQLGVEPLLATGTRGNEDHA